MDEYEFIPKIKLTLKDLVALANSYGDSIEQNTHKNMDRATRKMFKSDRISLDEILIELPSEIIAEVMRTAAVGSGFEGDFADKVFEMTKDVTFLLKVEKKSKKEYIFELSCRHNKTNRLTKWVTNYKNGDRSETKIIDADVWNGLADVLNPICKSQEQFTGLYRAFVHISEDFFEDVMLLLESPKTVKHKVPQDCGQVGNSDRLNLYRKVKVLRREMDNYHPQGHHNSPAFEFGVRGHWRQYKSGKRVFIHPHTRCEGKGPRITHEYELS